MTLRLNNLTLLAVISAVIALFCALCNRGVPSASACKETKEVTITYTQCVDDAWGKYCEKYKTWTETAQVCK